MNSPCQSCRISHRCLIRSVTEREAFFALADEKPIPDCEFQVKELFQRPERFYPMRSAHA